MGSRQGCGILRLGGILDIVYLRADSSAEVAADYDLYDLLQIALAHRRRLSLVASGRACRLACRRNDARVSDGLAANHRRAVEVCV